MSLTVHCANGDDLMPKRSQFWANTFFILCAAVSLFGAEARAKDIVWARYGDIDTLDPHRATSTLSLQVWSLIYDTLLATDQDGKPVPHIAKSWTTSPDGTEYTFALNDGVKCHDGTPLD